MRVSPQKNRVYELWHHYGVPHDVGNDVDDEEHHLPCERPAKRLKLAGPVFEWNAAAEGRTKRWRAYPLDIQDQIKECFESSSGAESIIVEIEGKVYTIDFGLMQQVALHSGYVRELRRING